MEALPKVIKNRKKRVGRGYGSGKGGHTVGRGQKGQKVRGKINILFEGVKVKKSLLRRLPLRRGKMKFSAKTKPVIVNLDVLNLMPKGSKVNFDSLIKAGIVKEDARLNGVKVLGRGKLTKPLDVLLPTSKSASRKIIKAGGSVAE